MKKKYVLLTIACFAIEIATIQLSLPKYTQIISSVGFLSMLFYFVLKSEGLIDKTSNTPKIALKKTKAKTPKHPESEPKTDDDKKESEDEESDFSKEWKNMEREAK